MIKKPLLVFIVLCALLPSISHSEINITDKCDMLEFVMRKCYIHGISVGVDQEDSNGSNIDYILSEYSTSHFTDDDVATYKSFCSASLLEGFVDSRTHDDINYFKNKINTKFVGMSSTCKEEKLFN